MTPTSSPRPRPLSELAARLTQIRPADEVALVAIDGRGGSGKSTLARALQRLIPNSTVIEFDDFYRPSATLLPPGHADVGGNFEWRRLRDQVLLPLSTGRPAGYQRYDWVTDSMAEWHKAPARGVVMVEGIYSTRDELRDFYDFLIWVRAAHDERLARGVERGGQDTRDRWLAEYMPEEERYLEAQSPWRFAHLVIDGTAREGLDPTRVYVEADAARDDFAP